MEPIFVAVLANDSPEIAAIGSRTPGAIAQRVEQDVLVAALPHWLYQGDTPLHLAAAGLRYEAARALLAAGCPVAAANRRGATALHYACDPRPSSETWDPAAQRRIIDLLVSRGLAVDQPDLGGVTALHRAVRARSPAAVGALLSAGANPRAVTKKVGSTALHLAVAPTGAGGTAGTDGPQIEIVRMLLAAGATMTDVDRNGVTVVDRIQSKALRKALAAGQL
jgi:ankyrin repeat protein